MLFPLESSHGRLTLKRNIECRKGTICWMLADQGNKICCMIGYKVRKLRKQGMMKPKCKLTYTEKNLKLLRMIRNDSGGWQKVHLKDSLALLLKIPSEKLQEDVFEWGGTH